MKHRTTQTAFSNLLPLRVHGMDYAFGLGPLAEDFSCDTDSWVYFPNIFAEPDKTQRHPENDLIIHPKNCSFVEAKSRNQKGYGGLREQSVQTDGVLLLRTFEHSSATHKNQKFITPFQLLTAANKVLNKSEMESPEWVMEEVSITVEKGVQKTTRTLSPLTMGQKGNYVTIKCNDDRMSTQSTAFIIELFCRFRELAWLTLCSTQQVPENRISIEGQRMGELPEPIPYTSDDPFLDLGPTMPEQLRYVDMTKPMHCMSTGASGSGKTANMIIPRLKAHLTYKLKDGTQGTALVVDPKRELARVTENHLTEHGQKHRLFMAGIDGRLKLYPKDTSLSLNDRVTLLANELDLNPQGKGDSSSWIAKSVGMLTGFVLAYARYYNHTGRNLFADLLTLAGREQPMCEDFWPYVQSIIHQIQEGHESVLWMNKYLNRIAEQLELPVEHDAEFRLLTRYANMDSQEAPNQIAYVTGGIEPALNALCDEGLANWLDTTPVPEVTIGQSNSFDLRDLIDNSSVIVFQPNETPSGDRGTRLIKAQFNRVAMQRRNMRQPVLLVADEFQRYISNDNESGEASLLDRCRAARVTFVCATQSLNALNDALSKRNQGGNPEFAVKSIMANISHLFFFQTNDQTTTAYLQHAIPHKHSANLPHPLEVLPLSALRVGEAYFVAPQGKWGRVQFKLINESAENGLLAA